MRTTSTTSEAENMDLSLTEKQEGIENHKQIAEHLQAASINHFKAATHLKAGDYEKAAQCAMSAKGYLDLASQIKVDDMNIILKLNI
jgi:uncharacterized Ntn-hydrolase superfamily protein